MLHEQVLLIHGGHPERFTLPCNFQVGADGKIHALLIRGGETIAVGSASEDGSGARLITSRLDRPQPDVDEFSSLVRELGGPGELVIEESLAQTARDACKAIDGTVLHSHFELALYRFEGDPPSDAYPDPAVREATEDDVSLIAGWTRAFDEETGYCRPQSPPDFDAIARSNIRLCRVQVLEADGVPVALGQRARNSKVGQNRIGLIFVPPEHRSRGYAHRIVNSLVSSVLAEDAVPCLFTDRSDPISNRLYAHLSFVRTEFLVHLQPSAD